MRKYTNAALFTLLCVLLCGPVIHAQYAMTSQAPIEKTTQSNALGYANNHKFNIASNDYAYFSVLTHDNDGNFDDQLFSSNVVWTSVNSPSDFSSVFLNAGSGVNVDNNPQRVAAITNRSDGYVQMVWYGSQYSYSDASYSDQIHYAEFDVSNPSTISILSESTPLSISGFSTVYPGGPPYSSSDLWQEHAAIAEDSSKNLYVVWESHSTEGVGIAMNVYNASSGTWSQTGTTSTPPYLTTPASQSRPDILAESPTLQYVFCYGEVSGQEQILYGVLNSGVFSGWSTVSSKPTEDQRHYSVALDPNGNVHVAWREGTYTGTLLKYRRGVPNGSGGLTWDSTQTISASTMTDPFGGATVSAFAGTPSISASSTTVRLVWTQWWNGFTNSAGQLNNNLTSSNMGDDDIVEGYGMFSYSTNGSGTWTTPEQLMSGYSSYPSLSTGVNNGIVLVNYPSYGCGSTCIYTLYFGNVY